MSDVSWSARDYPTSAHVSRANTIVIGAGIAGLYAALKCGANIVLEASSKAGGRVKTVETEPKRLVDYEAGPWRVHSSHRRLIHLLRYLHLSITPASSSSPYAIADASPSSDNASRSRVPGVAAGCLSIYDHNLACRGVAAATDMEISGGYEGFHAGAASAAAATYSVRHPRSGIYYVIDDGFVGIVRGLIDRLPKICQVNYGERVVDVERLPEYGWLYDTGYRYRISVRKRVGAGNRFEDKTYVTRNIVVAVPPRDARNWAVCRRWMRAQLATVDTLPLHHIYARLRDNSVDGRSSVRRLPATYLKLPRSRLGQVISGDYGRDRFQVSYTGGRRALFWNRLKLSSPTQFRALLARDMNTVLLDRFPESLHGVKLFDIRSHHWEHAVHFWRPAVGVARNHDRVRRCAVPHPVRLPGLVWCGEAFSGHQGWVEGALETTEIACDALISTKAWAPSQKKNVADGVQLVLEDRVIDATTWAPVHPGTPSAIHKYAGQDITELFSHINHSDNAWAHAFHLQVGWDWGTYPNRK